MNKISLFLFLSCLNVTQLPAAETGTIIGRIDKPQPGTSVSVIYRSGKTNFTGTLNAKTGKFKIGNLKLDIKYDFCVNYGDAILEGVDLSVPAPDYPEEEQITEDDLITIGRKVKKMVKFENVVDILTIRGNTRHAVVLLNRMRTAAFFGSKPGEMIWRNEIWHFERPDETWVKVRTEQYIVLRRERFSKQEFEKIALTQDASLGGLKPTLKKPVIDIGLVKLPPVERGIRLREEPNDTNNAGKP